jgi:molybdenum cofactor cytidylyltransferase
MSTRVAAILLGAGLSRRFGDADKLLAEVDGRPLAAHVAQVMADALPEGTRLLVVGPHGEGVRAACAAHVTDVVVNPKPERGLASSVATGVAALVSADSAVDGILVAQMDMPGLTVALIEKLLAAFDAHDGKKIVFPTDATGRQRTPVIWPVGYADPLSARDGDTGGKPLIAAAEARGDVVRVPLSAEESAALVDIDTRDQLAAWRGRQSQS